MYFKKQAFSAVALILVLAVSMLMASMSTVSAHTPPQTHPAWAYLALSPDPVGVSQSVYVIMWVFA